MYKKNNTLLSVLFWPLMYTCISLIVILFHANSYVRTLNVRASCALLTKIDRLRFIYRDINNLFWQNKLVKENNELRITNMLLRRNILQKNTIIARGKISNDIIKQIENESLRQIAPVIFITTNGSTCFAELLSPHIPTLNTFVYGDGGLLGRVIGHNIINDSIILKIQMVYDKKFSIPVVIHDTKNRYILHSNGHGDFASIIDTQPWNPSKMIQGLEVRALHPEQLYGNNPLIGHILFRNEEYVVKFSANIDQTTIAYILLPVMNHL